MVEMSMARTLSPPAGGRCGQAGPPGALGDRGAAPECAARGSLPAVAELIAAAAEDYAAAHTTPFDGPLAAAAEWTRANTPTPGMMSGLAEARLLEALIVVSGARSVLEVGTFTAVGSLAMAAALGADGRLITLERDAE